MKQISVFHKGITTDLDYSKLDNQNIQLPTANIQVLNKDGQGLIITPVKGNDVSFELTPGYLFIGAAEYNGIAYIVSYNPTLELGEVGSFPSPKTGGGFEEVYKPLMNIQEPQVDEFSIALPSPMRSGVFDFDLAHPIGDQMVALMDYDGSVNLIWTDNKNVLRLVNSGFDQDGIYLPKRFYNPNTLEKGIQLIKDLPKNQKIDFLGEAPGGQMGFGNYFFFYRYVTASNNRSPFVAESAPITVTRKSPERSEIQESGFDINSQKKINLKVYNLDSSFTYIEFAYIRFTSLTEDAVFPEVFVVDRFFTIPSNGGDLEVEITGYETQVPFDIAEIIRPVNRETICKSILSHERRIWGANWRTQPINYDALSEFALKINVGYDDTKTIPHWELRSFYANPENLRYSGYFRNEAYITGVVFVLNNGYHTERFPVKGIDARRLRMEELDSAFNEDVLTNENGIIIMPHQNFSPAFRNTQDAEPLIEGKILSLSFDVSKAKVWASQEGVNQSWFNENVREIVFVRAKRKPNLLYQGVMTRVYGRNVRYNAVNVSPMSHNSVSIPLFVNYDDNIESGGAMPVIGRKAFGDQGRSFPSWPLHSSVYDAQSEEEKESRALFSSDYIFGQKDKLNDGDSELFIQPEFKISYEEIRNEQIQPNTIRRRLKSVLKPEQWLLYEPRSVINVHSENNWIRPSNNKSDFVNRVDDLGNNVSKTSDTSNVLFWHDYAGNADVIDLVNRSIITPPYLGIKFESDWGIGEYFFKYPGRVLSLFRQNPWSFDGISLYSDELNLPYFSINHERYNISEREDSKVLCYQGDCFIQYTSVKTRTWFPSQEYGRIEGDEAVEVGADISAQGYETDQWSAGYRYAHGDIVDLLSENEINTALRFATIDETAYYPAIRDISVDSFTLYNWDWALFPYTTEVRGWGKVFGTGIESYLINKSNSQTISLRSYLSDNPFIPKSKELYPNRIRYTGKQEAGFPILAYRMWDYSNKEDYEERFGEITRIMIIYGRLTAILRNAIMAIPTSQEEVIPSSSGELVIGVRSILSKEPAIIARFGSQHIFAMKQAKSGVYGWDWMNNVMWRINMGDGGFLFAKSLDKEQLVENYLKELKARNEDGTSGLSTNIVRGLPDSFFLQGDSQEGLLLGYDKKFGEVLFSSVINGHVETFRFSEDIGGFVGTFHYPVKHFFNIDSDLFSVPNIGLLDGVLDEAVYVHGNGLPARFYQVYYTPSLSFIVNGFVQNDTSNSLFSRNENYANHDKLYKNMEIEAPRTPQPIDKILFKTLFQEAQNNPFFNEIEFWLQPEYLMSKWAFPLNIVHKGEEQFYIESNLNGKWLKVTIYFNKGIDFFVKNVITNFITSNA